MNRKCFEISGAKQPHYILIVKSEVMLTASLIPSSINLFDFLYFCIFGKHLDFYKQIKTSPPARCCTPCLSASSEPVGARFGYRDQSGSGISLFISLFSLFVVSLFHGLLMGSRPSFGIQRHAVLLMIIRSARAIGLLLIAQPQPARCSHHWTAMKQSQFAGPWGERKVQVSTTSHQCRFNPVLSC